MKRLFFTALIAAFSVLSAAADNDKEVAKTGWNIGPFPAISYSTDLGFQYGAVADIYNFGDGSKYPDYLYMFNVEASRFTKGNTLLHIHFDGKEVIPGLRILAAVTYLGNKTESFYGYNGASSVYFKELDKISDEGMAFYRLKRDQFRITTALRGKIGDSKWSWFGGLTFYDFKTGNAQNKSIKEGTPSLFDIYTSTGIINKDEIDGGDHFDLKAGFVYEGRDHENDPTKGANIELLAIGSYDFFQHRNNYLSLSARYVHFFPLVSDKLILGYQLAYQGTVLGEKPFYMLQNIEAINIRQKKCEGLGSLNTVRGTVASRMQGRGYAWTNIELRYNFLHFKFINQNFMLTTNPFFDAGMIVQPYRLDKMIEVATSPMAKATVIPGTGKTMSQLLYTGNKETLHASAGLGLHLIMNHNFNIRAEVAKTFNRNDGNIGVAIGLNYIF